MFVRFVNTGKGPAFWVELSFGSEDVDLVQQLHEDLQRGGWLMARTSPPAKPETLIALYTQDGSGPEGKWTRDDLLRIQNNTIAALNKVGVFSVVVAEPEHITWN